MNEDRGTQKNLKPTQDDYQSVVISSMHLHVVHTRIIWQ
ncbi:hypothetical protein [Dietzia maris]